MSLSPELKKIKKIYGENFMKLCRELFPTILEQEGVLTEILLESFSNNSRSLGEDIKDNNLQKEFKDYIFIKFDEIRENKEKEEINKTPYELLDEAGYVLYECTNENDYLCMHAELLNPRYEGYSTFYTFGNLENKYGKENISLNDIDVIKIIKDSNEMFLKRLYG